MDLTIAWHSNADRDIEAASLRNEPEMVRRINHGLERGTMSLESWVLTSGGQMVQSGGVDGQAIVPADHLDEILDILRQYQDVTEASVACGVGADSAEALTALTVAQKRGGDPAIVLYTPDIAHEADEDGDGELDPILPEDVDTMEGNQHVAAPTPGGSMAKAQFGNEPSPGEATQVASGALSPSAAQPSAPSPVSPPPAPPQDPQQQAAGGQPAGGGDDTQKLLQAVGGVLMDVKKQLPTLEGLKKENPAAYDSLIALTEALIALAQKLSPNGAAPGAAPVQKSEGEDDGADSDLAKGDVIPFPQDRVPPSPGDLGRDATVVQAPPRGSVIIDPNQASPKRVKNLGWLLRNSAKVKAFDLSLDHKTGGGHMVAHLHDGRRYETPWASGSLMTGWVQRPVFQGVPMTVGGQPFGSTQKSEGEGDPGFPETPEFKRGCEEEAREHPSISQAMVKRLVRDHLRIDPHYYDEDLEKVAPPEFDEAAMHKLKAKYGTKSAFRIAWAAHNRHGGKVEKAEEEFEKAEGALKPAHALHPTATGRHELHLPAGTSRGNKVKVVHSDGSTSWVQVGAGQITSEDGHPISSRNPGGR